MVKLLDEPKLDQTYIMGTNTSANYAFVLDLTEKGNVARLVSVITSCKRDILFSPTALLQTALGSAG